MKKIYLVLMAALAFIAKSCSSDSEGAISPPSSEGTLVEMVLPSGTSSVRIDYKSGDAAVHSVNAPVLTNVNYVKGMQASSVTSGSLRLYSANDAYVNIYDKSGNLLIENKFVKAQTKSVGETGFTLPEDATANYVTSDDPQTFYHSSGVVMFDDSWPNKPVVGSVDADFNDLVVDYDIETKAVDLNKIPDQAYREQCKVVMHIRAIGGGYPNKACLALEGLDTKYIKSVSAVVTLGNWNTAVPTALNNPTVDITGKYPIIKLNNLWWFSSKEAETFTYVNSKTGKTQVFNDLTSTTDNTPKFYNVNKGAINSGGDLITLTVIFKGDLRTELSAEESALQFEAYMNAVMDVNSQNFYLVTNVPSEGTEIHLKGYQPSWQWSAYKAESAMGNTAMDSTTTYATADSLVWGFKVPVLTRHAWEKVSFYKAYPEFRMFVQSNGELSKDWYKRPDPDNISIWW